MSAPWTISNIGAAGAQAAATQTTPNAAGTTDIVVRLRSLVATLAGLGNSASAVLVVCDGPSNSATSALAIWSIQMAAAGGAAHTIQLSDLDLRASPGNNLTVGFIAGGGGAIVESVNAIGDFIPLAAPALTPNL